MQWIVWSSETRKLFKKQEQTLTFKGKKYTIKHNVPAFVPEGLADNLLFDKEILGNGEPKLKAEFYEYVKLTYPNRTLAKEKGVYFVKIPSKTYRLATEQEIPKPESKTESKQVKKGD